MYETIIGTEPFWESLESSSEGVSLWVDAIQFHDWSYAELVGQLKQVYLKDAVWSFEKIKPKMDEEVFTYLLDVIDTALYDVDWGVIADRLLAEAGR